MKTDKKNTESGKNKNGDYHRSGRWLGSPKEEHKIILRALEISNSAFMRVANVSEVLLALSVKEKSILESKYGSSLNIITSKILGLLCKRGKVFVGGKSGKINYYGLVGLINPEEVEADNFKSRRQKVLRLVQDAVIENNRAIQMGEIIDFAYKIKEYSDIPPKLISQSVLSLRETGELLKFSLRGNEKGFGVYLPKEFDPNDFLPRQPLTWLEFVLSLFNEIWEEHILLAEKCNSKPVPVSTNEVRVKLRKSGNYSEKLQESVLLINALQQLAKTTNPSLRKIKRSKQKALFWLPVDVKDSDVNLVISYAHDTEKIEEAVKRASIRFMRPVNFIEIKEEVEMDTSLEPDSEAFYYSLLADLSKEKIAHGPKLRKPRRQQKIYSIGRWDGKTYYYFNNEIEATAFLKFRQLERSWIDLNPLEELTKVTTCLLPSVVLGRVKLLTAAILSMSEELQNLKGIKNILGVTDLEIKIFSEQILKIKMQINEWNKCKEHIILQLPEKAQNNPKGWTSYKLLEMLTPYYYRARNIKPGTTIQSLIGDSIRRIPNPDFLIINSKTPELAAEYLYDETDALIFIAKRWGGIESRYQASLAHNELGALRDYRFVIPELNNNDFNNRLSAVSCLAFLPSCKGNSRLRETALNDIDFGVRQSALWAYGFAGGENAVDFIKERELQDSDIRVRKFAESIIVNCREGWFNF